MGKSHQKGWVSIRGKKWYGYFRRTVIDPSTNQPKTVSTPVALGLKSEMTKFEAREKLELEIKRLTGQIAEDGVVRNGSVTFDWFVQNRYLPLKEADWKEETAKVKKFLIKADLVDAFRGVRLENIDKSLSRATSIGWPKPGPGTEYCRPERTCGRSSRRQSNRISFRKTRRAR